MRMAALFDCLLDVAGAARGATFGRRGDGGRQLRHRQWYALRITER